MDQPIESRPDYAALRAFKEAKGRELMRRYGAHGLGIGWKRKDGAKTDDLALIFYVDPQRSSSSEAAAIPPSFSFTPPGADAAVLLPTQVVEAPAATFESE